MTFGQLLYAHLVTSQVSQAELARRMGCDRSYITYLLADTRRPSERTVMTLAGALALTPAMTDRLRLVAGYAPARCPHCRKALEGAG